MPQKNIPLLFLV